MTPLTLQRRVRNNFNLLHAAFGGDSVAMAKATGISYSCINAFARKHQYSLKRSTCRMLEMALGLPTHWMDEKRSELDVSRASLRKGPRYDPQARKTTPELSDLRKSNLAWLCGSKLGNRAALLAKAGVSRTTPRPDQMPGKTLGARAASTWEMDLGLPLGWLDMQHDRRGRLPADFDARLLAVLQRTNAAPAQVASKALTAATPDALNKPTTWEAVRQSMKAASRATPVRSGSTAQAVSGAVSPVVRALLDKVVAVSNKGLLNDAQAVKILGHVVALEAA